jgi:RNA polymerase sigma-70 factor (ECF subfamily)
MSQDESSPDSLVLQAIAGDRDVIKQLLVEHADELTRYVTDKLGPSLQSLISPDDVVQETFIQAMASIGNCQAKDRRGFAAWLKGVSAHRMQDMVKSLKRKKRGGDMQRVEGAATATRSRVDFVELVSAQISTPSRNFARAEALQVLQAAIADLPEDQRTAVRMHYFEAKDVAEIAQVLDRSPAAIRGLLHRAMTALRGDLEQSAIWLSRK